jgi:hypothetical protein
MELKTLGRKLSLNKSTIANLNKATMGEVKGGTGGETGITCYYCDTIESCYIQLCDCDPSVGFECGYETQWCAPTQPCLPSVEICI